MDSLFKMLELLSESVRILAGISRFFPAMILSLAGIFIVCVIVYRGNLQIRYVRIAVALFSIDILGFAVFAHRHGARIMERHMEPFVMEIISEVSSLTWEETVYDGDIAFLAPEGTERMHKLQNSISGTIVSARQSKIALFVMFASYSAFALCCFSLKDVPRKCLFLSGGLYSATLFLFPIPVELFGMPFNFAGLCAFSVLFYMFAGSLISLGRQS